MIPSVGPCRCVFLLGLLAVSSSVCAQQAGDREKEFLRAAAAGHLENVIVVRMFDGFMALPRTFVLLGMTSTNVRFEVNLHTDSSLGKTGIVTAGLFVPSPDGKRKDVQSGLPVPSAPTRTEKRGIFDIEYFDPADKTESTNVLIRRKSAYLLLEGSASILKDGILDSYFALTGPPAIFSASWLSGSSGANRSGPSGADAQPCEARTVRFNIVAFGQPMRQMFRIYPGSDAESFRLTGLAADDMVVAINGRAVMPGDNNLYQSLHDSADGKPVTLSIKHGSSRREVTLESTKLKRALQGCPRR